jgi:CBS domain-containing protein
MLVESVMTHPVGTTQLGHSAASAAVLMRERRFRHLPVVVTAGWWGSFPTAM